jgi:primosomal protein N' (replication factor Y)
MRYAEVSVNSPLAQRRTFSYAIPPGMEVNVGQAVLVPFGERTLQGIVMALSQTPAVSEVRRITAPITPELVLSPARVGLARWLSEYYLCPLFEAVAMMLPPGFERRALTLLSLNPRVTEPPILAEAQGRVLELVKTHREVSLGQLERALGKKKAQNAVAWLVARNILVRRYELEPVKLKPKSAPYLELNVPPATAIAEAARLRERRALKMAGLLELLARSPGQMALSAARQKQGITAVTAKTLVKRGLVKLLERPVIRDPLEGMTPVYGEPPALTPSQQAAVNAIVASLRSPKPEVFLLHGVTASGKTEVYLRALTEAVKMGRRGIALVPEISLTPQTIERFSARFPGRVAVLHSLLSPGEQFDEWRRIEHAQFDVVIGPRSALFTPQPDLGLIIIDEEHEWSYKQDTPPRYHAREVALEMARQAGAAVVLGSATPDTVTYFHARRGDYRLLELPERVVPKLASPLPGVEIVDMRDELKAGQRGLFSRSLAAALAETIARGEQAILFLNRRGGANFVQCRNCGYTFRCRRCDVTLTHHPDKGRLVCHQCHYQMAIPTACPRCRSRQLNFLGTGTQKLEQETRLAFPQAKLLRWDSDVTTTYRQHQQIIDRFRRREADILLGTQMVAKGLDLPAVTLVGVVDADTSLNLPDFRAGERTFQLLSQVAGRAGRGAHGGRAIIQTYSPEHYAIKAAAGHDYALFYEKEMAYRRLLGNPPFNRLARLVFAHPNDIRARQEAESLKRRLADEIARKGIAATAVLGPAPAFIPRLRGSYRWQIMVRGPELSGLIGQLDPPRGWAIDIDPLGLA